MKRDFFLILSGALLVILVLWGVWEHRRINDLMSFANQLIRNSQQAQRQQAAPIVEDK